MPPRKKNYNSDALNPEDITRAVLNARQLVDNWLDQMVREKIEARSEFGAGSGARFRRKSNQTMREFTAALTQPLKETIEENYALPQEIVLALISAAMLIHLTYCDVPTKAEMSEEVFLNKYYGDI